MNYKPRTIRLCVVSPLYHPSLGGLGRQAQLLTERLAKEGVKVFVITRRMRNTPPVEFHPDVQVLKAWSIRPEVHHMPDVNISNILTSLSFCISCGFFLFRYRHLYDLVHFHGAGLPLIVNLPLLKLLRKKIIAKVAAAGLGTEAGSLRGRYMGVGSLMAKLLRGVDAFVATTEEIKKGLLRDGVNEKRIWSIPNFIDLKEYKSIGDTEKQALRIKLDLPETPLVLYVGRFVQRKGINYLLEAWKKVQKEVAQARLLLLGDGQTFEEMRRYAEKLSIAETTHFLGHVNNVQEYLQAADIFVLPSIQEGMPNALLEAMASGLPVVATRIGGVVDIIEDGIDGVLVEPADTEGLAEKILQLLKRKDMAETIACNAYQKIKNHYSLDSIAQRYIQLYRSIIRE